MEIEFTGKIGVGRIPIPGDDGYETAKIDGRSCTFTISPVHQSRFARWEDTGEALDGPTEDALDAEIARLAFKRMRDEQA